MAPWLQLQDAIVSAVNWKLYDRSYSELEPRANKNVNIHRLTAEQRHVLHIIVVAVSALSLAAGLIASHWFYRMRRSFRHDLIMLLIHCDIFKAVWFLAFPAVELVHGDIDSNTAFCQASGFFLAVAIEASDIAVAMIAIHTALYIFRGDQGLYPYRKAAYIVLFAFPIALASLSFICKPGYVNTGNFCYLRMEPIWVRLLLSWIPRYLTFAVIFITYLTVYIYVRILMRQFAKIPQEQREELEISLPESTDSAPLTDKRPKVIPPTPPIACHGLIPSAPASNRTSRDFRGRQFSVVSTISTLDIDTPQTKHGDNLSSGSSRRIDHGVAWKMPKFNTQGPNSNERIQPGPDVGDPALQEDTIDELQTPTGAYMEDFGGPSQSGSNSTTPPTRPCAPARDRTSSVTETSTTTKSRRQSVADMFLFNRPKNTRSGSTPSMFGQNLDPSSMVKTREKIRRQLRHLFVYPLVYVLCWVLPFVIHLTSYGSGAPYPVVAASLIILGLQGFIDAAVFSLKERPWRHRRRREPCRIKACFTGDGVKDAKNPNVGRTREEMLVDGRQARKRRDGEMEDRMQVQQAQQGPRKGGRDWWDHEDHHDHAEHGEPGRTI